jgi:NAD-dependent dihydropyrimidine dehydrogenase PreA subunit
LSQDVYRKLAEQLDTFPQGFTPTTNGAELRLLAKIFTPEEAQLAAVMHLNREPLGDIAERAGVDVKTARTILKAMVRKGIAIVGRKDRTLAFGLLPFVVGFYEEQLPRMDRELAQLFEDYVQAIRGLTPHSPPIHRVIPVEEAIPSDIDIFPYEHATAMVESAKAWGVRDCICRVQRKLIGQPCDHPVENCLVFAPVEGVFAQSEIAREITKEDALRILAEAQEAGLVHSPGNYKDGNYYICNCCTCSCGIMRSVAEFGTPTAIASSHFVAVVDEELCIGCGDCLARCQFEALIVDELCTVDSFRCVGCGLCVTVCPTEALSLERRAEGSVAPIPLTHEEWLAQRAEARGLASTP